MRYRERCSARYTGDRTSSDRHMVRESTMRGGSHFLFFFLRHKLYLYREFSQVPCVQLVLDVGHVGSWPPSIVSPFCACKSRDFFRDFLVGGGGTSVQEENNVLKSGSIYFGVPCAPPPLSGMVCILCQFPPSRSDV